MSGWKGAPLLSAARPMLAMLLMLAVVLGAIALTLSAPPLPLPGMDWLIPPPETAAEGLVSALAAHRYEGAMNALSQELRQRTSKEDLQALVKAIEDSPRRGIQDAHGQQADGQNNTATVEVKYGDNQTRQIEIPMIKENQVWRVDSLDGLKRFDNQNR